MQGRSVPPELRGWAREWATRLGDDVLAYDIRHFRTRQDDKLKAFALFFFGRVGLDVLTAATNKESPVTVRLAAVYSGRLNFVQLCEVEAGDRSSRVVGAAAIARSNMEANNPAVGVGVG